MINFIKVLLIWLLIVSPAFAADNTVVLTPGSGVTMRTKDIGAGVQSPFNILGDTSGASIYGTAGTANANVISVQGIASGTAMPVSISGTVTISGSNLSTASNQVTTNSLLTSILAGVQGSIPAGTATIGTVGQLPYPITATPYTTTITGSTLSTTATLAGAASVTTYICGFSIRANATAAATGNAQVTGTISGSLNFTQWTAPAASGLGVIEEIFNPCIPASATATSIAVVSAAPGSGGAVSVTAWGYKL